MIRSPKAFGVVLFAVVALGVVPVSAAAAEFTSGSDNTTLKAQALTTLQFASGEELWACNELSLDGASLGTVQEEVTAEPTFGSCITTAPGVGTAEAKIDTNGCHFLLTASKAIHITCPEGKQIEVTEKLLGKFRNCLDIHAQTPTASSVDYINRTNEATGKMDIEVESTVEGITYEKTGSCAFGATEENDWTFIGKLTLTGVNANAEPVDVTVN
jgi:hypothetical protein